jgi:hypothetical protein
MRTAHAPAPLRALALEAFLAADDERVVFDLEPEILLLQTRHLEPDHDAGGILEDVAAEHRPPAGGQIPRVVHFALVRHFGAGSEPRQRAVRGLREVLPALGDRIPQRAQVLFQILECHGVTSCINRSFGTAFQ